jgi:hypothetical protein
MPESVRDKSGRDGILQDASIKMATMGIKSDVCVCVSVLQTGLIVRSSPVLAFHSALNTPLQGRLRDSNNRHIPFIMPVLMFCDPRMFKIASPPHERDLNTPSFVGVVTKAS